MLFFDSLYSMCAFEGDPCMRFFRFRITQIHCTTKFLSNFYGNVAVIEVLYQSLTWPRLPAEYDSQPALLSRTLIIDAGLEILSEIF